MVSGLSSKNYHDRLKEVGLTTLETRRERGDMIQIWKIVHQKDNVDPAIWFEMASVNNRLTRHSTCPWNINSRRSKDTGEIRNNYFSVRVVDKWNSLPESVKSSSTLNNFKNNYDSHLAAIANIPY